MSNLFTGSIQKTKEEEIEYVSNSSSEDSSSL